MSARGSVIQPATTAARGAAWRRLLRRPLPGLLLATALSGCVATPPSGWPQGGARLTIPRARWVYGEQSVELGSNGRVVVSGTHWLTIDSAGRAYNPNNEPIALLRPDGVLMGSDDEPLGWVGAGESMLPGGHTRWMWFLPSGEVVRRDGGGQRPFGVWIGCNQVPYTLQACALVTHLLAQSWSQIDNRYRRQPGWGPRGPGFLTPFP